MPNRRALRTTPAGNPGYASQQRGHRGALPGVGQDMEGIPKCRPLARQKTPPPRVGAGRGWGISGFSSEPHEEASQHSDGAFLKAVISSEPALTFTEDSHERKQPKNQLMEKVRCAGGRETTSLLHPIPLEHQDLPQLERATEPTESHKGKVTKQNT